jgi:cytochrome c-type biogenesis protein
VTLDFAAVYGAGLLTFVSPCVLPLIPIYLALLAGSAGGDSGVEGETKASRARLVINTLLFSLGMMVVFVLLGLSATSIGALLIAQRTRLVIIGGLLIFLFGLKFLGVLQLGWLDRERRWGERLLAGRSGPLGALLMGVVFSLAWTPCVGPILGSVLTYTASTTAEPLRGALYLGSYGLGFTSPLVAFALSANLARRAIGRLKRSLPRIQRVSGALMLLAGLYLLLGASAPPAATRTEAATAATPIQIAPPIGEPSSRPRMVQFSASSCSICRQMIPTVAVIERDCHGRQVDVIKLDVDTETHGRVAARYRVRGVPTFVFLGTDGEEVARLVGYQTLGALRQALAALVGESCRGLGSFDPGSNQCGNGETCLPFRP